MSNVTGPVDCPFCCCQTEAGSIVTYGSAFALHDRYPVTPGHLLIVPKRHTADYFSLTAAEKLDCDALLTLLRKQFLQDDPAITGFNIGINCGVSSGQTVFHCHIHLIPRRNGDTPDPRGGVRGVIPEKMHYPNGRLHPASTPAAESRHDILP